MNTPKTSPKDFFLHLGATVTLYVAVGAIINLWFSIINYYFPDQLAGSFYANTIAWPISMLVVLVPLLYIIEWLIHRDISRMPEKADIWIRKWRIYLTLFLVVVLIGGDLITLINTYLNGEITARLVWKVVAVLLIGGAIGKYYFFSLYPNFRYARTARRINFWFGIIFVLAAIVIGFVAVGSPMKQRDLRSDSRRVSDLQNIQWQVVNYWQQKQELPKSLDDLNNTISGYVVPTDPETDEVYIYNVVSTASNTNDRSSFQLCTTFKRASEDTRGRGEYYGGGGMYTTSMVAPMAYPVIRGSDVWTHAKGRACFDRTIDPDKYPPIQKLPR